MPSRHDELKKTLHDLMEGVEYHLQSQTRPDHPEDCTEVSDATHRVAAACAQSIVRESSYLETVCCQECPWYKRTYINIRTRWRMFRLKIGIRALDKMIAEIERK